MDLEIKKFEIVKNIYYKKKRGNNIEKNDSLGLFFISPYNVKF